MGMYRKCCLPMGGTDLGPSWEMFKVVSSRAHGEPKLGPIMGGAQVQDLMGPWGAETWAQHSRGSRLGVHKPIGCPNFGPSWAGLKFWPLMGQWGSPNFGPSWTGLKLVPSWTHGGPILAPSWADLSLSWGAQTWAHHRGA
jgi:hypothetical protein